MTDRYSRTAAWLHWIIAALILFNLASGLSEGALGSIRTHKAVGLTILALSLVRLGWRLTHKPPPFPADVTPLEARLAKGLHALFYALMIVVPLAGWIMVSNAPKLRPLTWFGLFDVPYLTLSPAVYDTAREAHELLAIGFGLLLIGHVGAAVRHHFIRRDRLIERMNPLAKDTA